MIVDKQNCCLTFIFIILCGITQCFARDTFDFSKPLNHDGYVDPHSVYYNKHTKTIQANEESVEPENKKINTLTERKCSQVLHDCLHGKTKDVPDEMFSRRLINMLLGLAVFEENDSFFTSNIVIELTKDELKKLKDFGLGKVTIKDIDSIVTDVFKSPNTNALTSALFIFKSFFIPTASGFWPYKEWIVGSIIFLYMTWTLLKCQWTCFKMILFSIFIIFVVSFTITYLQMYEEAKIKLTAKQLRYTEIPIQCQPYKMTWFDIITTLFSSDTHCQKYQEAIMENPFLQVTPAQALSRMLAVFSFEPIKIAGSTVSEFVKNSIENMPIWTQWALGPILTVLIITAIILITMFILFISIGGSLSLGLGPLKFLSLQKKKNTPQENSSVRSLE
ncbi:uncharacterized protein LOC122848671 isoform X2 [Aphidius gifuensis]|uniref:uncharacterized protein LOC122848671 isoform X2 n=1 Tax=Aphidius gifuensis TaxID=684658 RepID=UPI001CDCB426|nr:uncharacterized protein LOC122848671 isoform X2 [Aphidius gifuensis]